MLWPRRTELLSRVKAAGIRTRDLAALLNVTPCRVSQMLGGFCNLSASDEIRIIRFVENVEASIHELEEIL